MKTRHTSFRLASQRAWCRRGKQRRKWKGVQAMGKVRQVQRAFVLMNLIARSCRDFKKRNCHAAKAPVDPVSVRGLRKRNGSLSARNAQYKRGCTSQHGQQLARRWGVEHDMSGLCKLPPHHADTTGGELHHNCRACALLSRCAISCNLAFPRECIPFIGVL